MSFGQDGWSGTHSGGVPSRQSLLGKRERGGSVDSNGSLAVLAPINVNEKGTEISVLVQDRNGCMQSRQRFLHQPGDVPVLHQSTTRRMCEGWMNEANCSQSEQTMHRQTGMASSRTGTAIRSKAMVATQSSC